MTSRRRRQTCQCSRTLPLSSAVLFLSAILPSSSFAQLENTSSENAPFSSSPSTASNNVPTTFRTSTSPPASTASSQANPTQDPAPIASTATDENDDGNHPMFNYYFVIVAAAVLVVVLGVLYIGKRKKQKAAMMRSNSRAALARDVEGFRNRFGMGRGAMRRAYAGGARSEVATVGERLEGLDERGEAPPPYNPGSKPPSIRSGDGIAVREVNGREEGVPTQIELRTVPGQGLDPPGYHEDVSSRTTSGEAVIAIPAVVVTPGPARDVSIRSTGTVRAATENEARS